MRWTEAPAQSCRSERTARQRGHDRPTRSGQLPPISLHDPPKAATGGSGHGVPYRRPALLADAVLSQTGEVATEGSGQAPFSAPAGDPDDYAGQLAREALAAGDPMGWFERLYAAAEAGHAVVPWDRGAPHYALVAWAGAARLDGRGRRAVVVGCGLGADAEFVAGLGYETVAFDVPGGAIRAARRRFPQSVVHYVTADALDPPVSWHQSFDLVVESLTVQALPDPPRREAIASIGRLVAPGGTLIVIARARAEGDDPQPGPPWALSRAEIDSFAAAGLQPVRIEELRDPGPLATHRWRAEFRRP